jgi:catechol 2,3-dioxygenase
VELFNTHYQMMDIENEPVRWNLLAMRRRSWGLPPRRQWYLEASRFRDTEPRAPAHPGDPMTLERFLAEEG